MAIGTFAPLNALRRSQTEKGASTVPGEKELLETCSLSVEAALARLGTTDKGVSEEQVRERRAKYGLNEIAKRKKLSLIHPEWAELLNGRVGVACLALATSIAAWVNAMTLFILLRRKLGVLGGGRILRTILKSGVGCIAMGLFCWGIMHLHIASMRSLAAHERLARMAELVIAIAGGAGIYMFFAKLLRMEEWEPFWSQMKSRRAAAVEVSE